MSGLRASRPESAHSHAEFELARAREPRVNIGPAMEQNHDGFYRLRGADTE